MPASAETSRLTRDWRIFGWVTFLFSFGFNVYNGVFQNFLRDSFHAGPIGLGTVESTREIPGLLAALMTGVLVALAETHIAAIGLAIAALGIAATAMAPSFGGLVGITVFWSVGFHLFTTMSGAISLALSKGSEGKKLGGLIGLGGIATIAALGASWIFARVRGSGTYAPYFWVGGASILASALLCSGLSAHANSKDRAPIILRREYGLYYLLIFLEGCRRQIFSIFASFALVLVYRVPVERMLLLQFINAIMIAFTAPKIGALIDRKGERGPLAFYSIGLIAVFLGYATLRTVGALYALFLIDNVLFSFNVGFTTYLNRIVRPGELTPCLAMGVTMNHVAAVTVPIGGAILWERTHDYQAPFWVGVGIAGVSLLATFQLPSLGHNRKEAIVP